MHDWLRQTRITVADGRGLAKAIDYSLKRWPALSRYATDGRLPIDKAMVSYCTSYRFLEWGSISSVHRVTEIGFQQIDILGHPIETTTSLSIEFAGQQFRSTPILDRALRDLKPSPKLFGRPKALFLEALSAILEFIGGAQPNDAIEGIGHLPVSAVPALIQNRRDLQLGVCVEKRIDC